MNELSTTGTPAILIVDDDALLRFNAADFLSDAGFEAIEAENAAARSGSTSKPLIFSG